MTFGKVKSIIEKKLIDSYINESHFKKTIKQFEHNILKNNNVSKIYSLYDQLSTPQGLNESDSKEFLDEGISIIQKLLPNVKLPKTVFEIENKYSDIDTLVYGINVDISDRLQAKKRVVSVLMSENKVNKETINVPIKSMVNIANKTLSNFIKDLNESDKKELLKLMSEDTKSLEKDYVQLRENTVKKLNSLLENENEFEVKTKLSETIERIKNDKFDQLNYFKLKSLSDSI